MNSALGLSTGNDGGYLYPSGSYNPSGAEITTSTQPAGGSASGDLVPNADAEAVTTYATSLINKIICHTSALLKLFNGGDVGASGDLADGSYLSGIAAAEGDMDNGTYVANLLSKRAINGLNKMPSTNDGPDHINGNRNPWHEDTVSSPAKNGVYVVTMMGVPTAEFLSAVDPTIKVLFFVDAMTVETDADAQKQLTNAIAAGHDVGILPYDVENVNMECQKTLTEAYTKSRTIVEKIIGTKVKYARFQGYIPVAGVGVMVTFPDLTFVQWNINSKTEWGVTDYVIKHMNSQSASDFGWIYFVYAHDPKAAEYVNSIDAAAQTAGYKSSSIGDALKA